MSSSAFAQSDQSVYADALANGWQNWSWATVNLNNGAPVQVGIAVDRSKRWRLGKRYTCITTRSTPSLYTNLTFWIHGGSTGGQLLQFRLSSTAPRRRQLRCRRSRQTLGNR